MDQLGFETAFDGNQISIKSASSINTNHWKVESDWSSALLLLYSGFSG